MTIVDQLENWLSENHRNLEKQGFSIARVKCKPTDNSAIYFDIDVASLMARATIWESLEVDFDVFELDGEKQIIAEYHQGIDPADLIRLLDKFFARLKELPNKSTD